MTLYINELIKNEDGYIYILDKYQNILINQYSKKDDLLKISINDKEYSYSIANVYTQLVLLYPFVSLGSDGDIPEDFIILDELNDFSADLLQDYMDKLTIEFMDSPSRKVNNSFRFLIERLTDISAYSTISHGLTVNLYDLLELSTRDKDFDKLLRFKISDDLSFDEIDIAIDEAYGKMENILKDSGTCYEPYLHAKTGINPKQLKECVTSIGNKPDLDGSIIPYPIDSNFIFGLNTPRDYTILSKGARKALINNHSKVTESGYLTRKLSLLNMDTVLDHIVKDCGSTDYLVVPIPDKQTLYRYDKRYYLDPETQKLAYLHAPSCEHLIGKSIMLRSPMSCKSDGICPICYGGLSEINKDIHIGLIGVLYLTSQLTQTLLSTKHLLQSDIDEIIWSTQILNKFTIDRNLIYLDSGISGSLVVSTDKIDYTIDNEIYFKEFTLQVGKKKIEIESPVDLYLDRSLQDKLQSVGEGELKVSLSSLDQTGRPVFSFIVENNELTESLNKITQLIDSRDHLGVKDAHSLASTFIALLNETGIKLNAVHTELILRNLLRKPDNPFELAKSLKPGTYNMSRVSEAIINHESPIMGLVFEKQKMQLQNPYIYSKEGSSIIDPIFL